MNARQLFHQMMRERRHYPRGSAEWEWLTRSAMKIAAYSMETAR